MQPCYHTSAHDWGKKPPSDVDMPLRWHGAAGGFAKGFEVDTPGKGVTINLYRNRGLRTAGTKSKVHREFDLDF